MKMANKGRFAKILLFMIALALLLGAGTALAEEIISQEHVWDSGAFDRPADCDHPERWIYHCTLPGCTSIKYEYVGASDPNAHIWGPWIADTAPTCITAGYGHRVCTVVVHHVEYGPIPATGHDWGDWETVIPATCEEDGLEQSVCRNDASHVQTRVVPATGHDWGDWETVIPATCEEEGLEKSVCRNDASHVRTRVVPPLGHDWDEGKITKQPTLEEEGEKTYTCQNDPSHTKTEVIPRLFMGNNTVCAFGPRLRETDLAPYSSDRWYMFTPFDASQDGEQVFELVASNQYIVGTATLTIEDGAVSVDYQLYDNRNFTIKLEFFTILNSIHDLSQYEPEELLELKLERKQPVSLADTFGDDTSLVLYFCSRCDYTYSPLYRALNYQSAAHQEMLNAMLALMD